MMSPDLLTGKSAKINQGYKQSVNSRADRDLHRVVFRFDVQTGLFERLNNRGSGMKPFHTLAPQLT
jgi:hypothetical protein